MIINAEPAVKSPKPKRDIPPNRVIHVWVDPRYGDDATALAMNPRFGYPSPGHSHVHKPNDHLDANNKVLLHAPWPFKHISGPTGALSYIPALPYPPQQPDNVIPPATTSSAYVWDSAIIHLLPGRYAEGRTAMDPDPVSGIKANNEPGLSRPPAAFNGIKLPNRVSIQGTSALNTVLDLEGAFGPFFEFGTASNNQGIGSFIDCVTFLGALDIDTHASFIQEKNVAAIYMGRGSACELTISNCFFLGNRIGVMIDAPNAATPSSGFHKPVIMNNTFAWNDVGIWNGQSKATGDFGVGVSHLIVVNNIFDVSPIQPSFQPLPPNFSTITSLCFDGVALADLQVKISASTFKDFNAYQGPTTTYCNGGRAGLPATILKPTTLRGAGPSIPGIDISPFVGDGGNARRRGVLFIRDLFLNGTPFNLSSLPPPWPNQNIALNTGNWDRSMHDFRLAPAVAPHTSATSGPPATPNQMNPLVDAGWNGPFPLEMKNLRTAGVRVVAA